MQYYCVLCTSWIGGWLDSRLEDRWMGSWLALWMEGWIGGGLFGWMDVTDIVVPRLSEDLGSGGWI